MKPAQKEFLLFKEAQDCILDKLLKIRYFLKDFIYLFLDREEGRERDINVWLPLSHPLLVPQPTTQACALDWELNLQQLRFISRHSIHWAIPTRTIIRYSWLPSVMSLFSNAYFNIEVKLISIRVNWQGIVGIILSNVLNQASQM